MVDSFMDSRTRPGQIEAAGATKEAARKSAVTSDTYIVDKGCEGGWFRDDVTKSEGEK